MNMRYWSGLSRAICLALATLAAPAAADVAMVQEHVFDTRFGQVQVVGGEVDQRLWFAGDFLDGPDDDNYWIRAGFGMDGEAHDWVIVSSHHMGNMCGGYSAYYLLQVGPEVARVSPRLDACRGIRDVRVLPGEVEVDLSHFDVGISHETFTWDGVTLSSVVVPAADAAPAGAGADVTRWIGDAPNMVFQDAGERARFGAVMSPDEIQVLSEVVSMGDSVFEADGWVIGRGCVRHACNAAQGLWGLRIADGAVAATILTSDGGAQSFGLTADPTIATAIAAIRR